MRCNKKFSLDVNGHLMGSSSSAFSSFSWVDGNLYSGQGTLFSPFTSLAPLPTSLHPRPSPCLAPSLCPTLGLPCEWQLVFHTGPLSRGTALC